METGDTNFTLFALLWGSIYFSRAYPRCGRGFRAVALCLAKIEPFNWPSDSSSTEIRLLAVLLSGFSRQMQAISQGL